MAIHIFTGNVGSGKTYHIVNQVIIPFLLEPHTAKRKIIHNVRLNNHVIESEFLFPFALSDRVRQLSNSDMESAILDMEKIAGSLVVIDEFQLIWPSSKGMTNPKHLEFFTTHRHHMIDICIGTQDIENIVKVVRNLVEVENHFKALKDVGFSGGYVVERYYNRSKKLGSRFNAKYDPDKFKFYNSHALSATSAGLKETPMVKSTRLYRVMIAVSIVGVLIAGCFFWTAYKRFSTVPVPPAKPSAPLTPEPLAAVVPSPASNAPKGEHLPVIALSYSGQPITIDKSFRVTSLIRLGLKRVYTLSDLSERLEDSLGKSFRVVRYDDSWQVGELVQVGNEVPHWSPSPSAPVAEKNLDVYKIPVSRVQVPVSSAPVSVPEIVEASSYSPPADYSYGEPLSVPGDISSLASNPGLGKTLRFGMNSVPAQNPVTIPGFRNLQNR